MAIRPTVVRRKVVEPEPEDFEEVEDGEVEEGEVEDVEEEEEEPAPPKKKIVPPPPVKKAAAPVAKKPARPVVEDDEDEEVEEEEEEPAPKKRVVPPAPVAKKAVAQEDQAPAPKVKTVATTVVDNLLPALLESLEAGKAIIITRISDDKWQVAQGSGQVMAQKMSPREYEQTVHTEEYLAWAEEWRTKTAAEKAQFAKTNKIKYPQHEDPRVEAIGLAEAVMEHLGIEKYKPGYERPSVRRALRGK